MNAYLFLILILILGSFVLDLIVDRLNLTAIDTRIPDEFKDVYDAEKYSQSQQYLRDSTRFSMIRNAITVPVTLGFILLGGFAWVDSVARAPGWPMIPTGLLFAAVLLLLAQVMSVPFSLYDTFVLEERYGFNRTTPKTFVLDLAKGLALGALIGLPLFAVLLWFFSRAGTVAWLYSWAVVTVVQLVLMYVAPAYIMPLFNKFEPLEEGELRSAIQEYADREGFALEGIYSMDGSKRSARANAFFTGFGRMKRIVLFDTLIEKHSVDELVGILAHEIGHYKLRHIHKTLLVSVLSTGLMLFLLSIFLRAEGLYEAFGVSTAAIHGFFPIYGGMIFFGYLYAPISLLTGILVNRLSRKHEYEADAFAVRTTPERQVFIDALKKLTVDNLGNLRPHALKVLLEYSHPPVLQRIRAIRSVPAESTP